MAVHRFSLYVGAPPERVFAAWIDKDRWPEWIGGVKRVTDVTGPLDRAGTRYTVWFGPMSSPSEVLAAETPRHLRTRFGNLLLRGETDVWFEPESGGTRLIQEFRVVGLVPRLFARLFATGSYRGSFRGELAAFRQIVERAEREAAGPIGQAESSRSTYSERQAGASNGGAK